jgi:ABC-2 type transport system ATP-binding protein
MGLLGNPEILLVDEATTGVDVAHRHAIIELLRGIAAGGASVCVATHYLDETAELGATIALMVGGRVVARGTVDDFVSWFGRSAVVLSFDGPPPGLDVAVHHYCDGNTLRFPCDRPSETAAKVLSLMHNSLSRLCNVAFERPSLDSVLMGLEELGQGADRRLHS